MKNMLKSISKTFNHGEKGSAFPIVLIMLLLAGLMIPPLMSLIGSSLVAGSNYEANSQALYAADAGVMDATWLIQSLEDPGKGLVDPARLPYYFGTDGTKTYPYTLPDKINGYTVSYGIVMDPVMDPADLKPPAGFIITSTATGIDGSTTTIETRVSYQQPIPPVLVAAGALDGTLILEGGIIVGADSADPENPQENWVNVYANGDLNIGGNSVIWGYGYYTDPHACSVYGTAVLHGNGGVGLQTEEMIFDDSIIPAEPTDSITPATGTLEVSAPKDKTVYFGPKKVIGNLVITGLGTVELTGTIWVTGTISVNSQVKVTGKDTDGDPYFMISESNHRDLYNVANNAIMLTGGSNVNAILYAKNGGVFVAGTSSLTGAAIGLDCVIKGGCLLRYPLPFLPLEMPYRPVVTKYWKII